jgi:hypothetical protein
MGAEADLILSQSFKALEPSQQPKFGAAVAINDLYYLARPKDESAESGGLRAHKGARHRRSAFA